MAADATGIREYKGAAKATTITAGIASGSPTFSIADSTGWPTGAVGNFVATSDGGTSLEERMLCSALAGGVITVVTRGYDGTSAVAHAAGSTFVHTIAAVDIAEANYIANFRNQTAKTTPADTDLFPLNDTPGGNLLKNFSWANLKAAVLAWFSPAVATLTNKDLSSSTNTLPPIKDKGGQVFNVMAYGAKGDGVTDDSTAIQSAIAAAQLYNGAYGAYGAIVFFPAGTYQLTAAGLTVGGSGVTLQGAGQLSTIINVAHNATIVPITVSGTGATPGTISTYSNDVVIRDLKVNMNFGAASAGAANNTYGISLSYVTRPKLINVSITNFGTGLYVKGTVDLIAESVSVSSTNASVVSAYGIYIDGAYQNASAYFSHCVTTFGGFTGTTSYGWYATGAHLADLFIHFCEGDQATYGFYYDGTSAATAVDTIDVHIYQFVADGCLNGMNISNIAETGGQIQVDGLDYFPSGNNGTGLILNAVSGVHVRGITAYSNASTGCIGVHITSSKDWSISQSNFKGNFQQFIYLTTCPYGSITNCDFVATSSVASSMGVYSAGASKVNLAGNTFRASVGFILRYGIYVATPSSTIIGSGNQFDTVTVTTPVVIEAGATLCAFSHNPGLNPVGSAVPGTAFAIGASTVAATNNTGVDGTLYVTAAGTVTAVSVNGVAVSGTLAVGDTYRIAAGGTFTLTYTVAPTVVFVGD